MRHSGAVQVRLGYKGGLRVLVVEDEPSLSEQLAAALAEAGYAVDSAADGERADFLGQTERYDAVVLDLGLPKVDGLTVLRRWREAGLAMPVLLLTARGSWHEKVQGIDSGADDYVSKPFRIEEVLARLRALIRRASGQVTPLLRSGPVLLDPRSAKVTVEGVPVKLTGHEFRVLSYLMHHRGRVVSQASSASTSTRRISIAIRTPSRCSSHGSAGSWDRRSSRLSAGSAIESRRNDDGLAVAAGATLARGVLVDDRVVCWRGDRGHGDHAAIRALPA